jgi:Fic family protein
MKIPIVPGITDDDMRRAMAYLADPAVMEVVFDANRRYLHWDEVRYRKLPADPHIIWTLMKLFRRAGTRSIPFPDLSFGYTIPDSCLEILHHIDKTAGGNLSAIVDTAGHDKERYIISSLMEEAIASNQLEGAATTRRVALRMLEEQRKPVTRDERMIVNGYRTMKEIRSLLSEDLTPDLLLRFQRMITDDTLDDPSDVGRLRDNDEIIILDGSGTILHTPPPYTRIPDLLDALCRFAHTTGDFFIHPIVKGIILHFLMGYIHPFNDGNGRTARTLFYWYVLKNDYWLFEYMPISRAIYTTRGHYKRAYLYTETDDCDLTYFITYNLRVIGEAITDLQRYINNNQKELHAAISSLEASDGLNLRQVEILRRMMKRGEGSITIKEVSEVYHVAYATARSDLFGLVDHGYFRKRKLGREYHFFYQRERSDQVL